MADQNYFAWKLKSVVKPIVKPLGDFYMASVKPNLGSAGKYLAVFGAGALLTAGTIYPKLNSLEKALDEVRDANRSLATQLAKYESINSPRSPGFVEQKSPEQNKVISPPEEDDDPNRGAGLEIGSPGRVVNVNIIGGKLDKNIPDGDSTLPVYNFNPDTGDVLTLDGKVYGTSPDGLIFNPLEQQTPKPAVKSTPQPSNIKPQEIKSYTLDLLSAPKYTDRQIYDAKDLAIRTVEATKNANAEYGRLKKAAKDNALKKLDREMLERDANKLYAVRLAEKTRQAELDRQALKDEKELIVKKQYEQKKERAKSQALDNLEAPHALGYAIPVDNSALPTKPRNLWHPFKYTDYCADVSGTTPRESLGALRTNLEDSVNYPKEDFQKLTDDDLRLDRAASNFLRGLGNLFLSPLGPVSPMKDHQKRWSGNNLGPLTWAGGIIYDALNVGKQTANTIALGYGNNGIEPTEYFANHLAEAGADGISYATNIPGQLIPQKKGFWRSIWGALTQSPVRLAKNAIFDGNGRNASDPNGAINLKGYLGAGLESSAAALAAIEGFSGNNVTTGYSYSPIPSTGGEAAAPLGN